MKDIPNPMIDPITITDIPSEELLLVAVILMIGIGFFIGWVTKKIGNMEKKYEL